MDDDLHFLLATCAIMDEWGIWWWPKAASGEAEVEFYTLRGEHTKWCRMANDGLVVYLRITSDNRFGTRRFGFRLMVDTAQRLHRLLVEKNAMYDPAIFIGIAENDLADGPDPFLKFIR